MSVIKLDSRKFLGAINNSAQAKVAFFEERLQKMGQSAGKNWQLVALRDQDLFFEDIDKNQFYLADHASDHGKVTINNIRQISVYEKEKQVVFEDACTKLVNAIEENDQRGMQAMFNTMKKHRFSGRSIPYSGMVQCRDGVTRHVSVATENAIDEDVRPQLVRAIVEGLQDRVVVENGEVISANFNDGSRVSLPVTKWASRKLVAKRMRDVASNAYWSEGFQKRILQASSMIAEGRIEEAVRLVSPFLDEMEEFTLLSRKQIQTLVENTLATQAVFNQQLCNDTATLFHRTNLRLNRNKIIDEWKNIARGAEHHVLAENVQILSETKNFETTYDKFLELIFEAISNREVAAEALATTLSVLKDKTPRIKESHDLSSKLDGLITRLKNPNFDDAAIYEAEDLIATIQEELAANETLNSFDQMPGDSSGGLADELTADLGSDDIADTPEKPQSQAPVININSPLIQIGGTSAGGAGGADDLGGLGGEEDLGLGGEEAAPGEEEDLGLGMDTEDTDELGNMLGGQGGAGALGESRRRKNRKTIKESRPVHYEMKDEDDDDLPVGPDDRKESEFDELEESNDPYAFSKKVRLAENILLSNYGSPVITDERDLRKVVQLMERLAEEHNLQGRKLQENLEDMAKAGIKAIGLRIPEGRLGSAIEQVISVFTEGNKPFPGAAKPFGSTDDECDSDDESCDSDDESCDSDTSECDTDDKDDKEWKKPWENDEGVAEDQFKGPRRRPSGYRRSSINKQSVKWGTQQEDAVAGAIDGVNFILDHGGLNSNMPLVILSEDGAVEIPVPEELYNEALASTGIMEGSFGRFEHWLSGSIEQLRPISSSEERALQEAMAKITTTPDGQITVEVSDDIDVNEMGEAGEMGDMDGDMDDDMDGDGDADDMGGMAPVDSVMPPDAEEMGGGEDEDAMPDFEDDGEEEVIEEPANDEVPGEVVEGGPEEDEEEARFEDKDITSPKSAKYTKHVKDNKREAPTVKMTKPSQDKLEGIGPDLKKDDGTGTKPPTARKSSKE